MPFKTKMVHIVQKTENTCDLELQTCSTHDYYTYLQTYCLK